MGKFIIRLLSFFAKEVNEIRRQPRLVLSLIMGPFLVLLLFGAGYQNQLPILRTVLVIPEEGMADVDVQQLAQAIDVNFHLVEVTTDRSAALERLAANELDVVQIIPGDIEARVLAGQQSDVEFIYNTINPVNEQWIQYLAYSVVGEINRMILLSSTAQLQAEAGEIHGQMIDTREQLDTLESNLSAAQQANVQQSVRSLRESVGVLALSPLLLRQRPDTNLNPQQVRRDLLQLETDLEAIDRAISTGQLAQQQARISATRDQIAELEATTELLSNLPPEVIVSPLQYNYANIRGQSLELMAFYAPGVVALLIQHIAVTLGALSLVRERLLGAFEIFRVAPVTSYQMLSGKYMSYTLFTGVIGAVLAGLLLLLGVPFLGDPWLFAGLVLLLTIASLSVGFFISVISSSDSQAVQLSMLVLLLSIFFSGFFLPLDNFLAPVRAVGYALPLTHGVNGFQDILLRGVAPGAFTWAGLGAIAGVMFLAVAIGTHRQFHRA